MRVNDFALEFVADNYAPFYNRPIECTDRDAPFVLDGVPVPDSPQDWCAERRFALDEGLRRLVAAARAGALDGGSIEDSVLRVERTEAAVPDGGR